MSNRLKRTAVAITAAAMAVSLSACAGGESANGEANAADRVLTLGNVLPESHPWNSCGAAEFEEALAAADVGLSLSVYPAGQTQADTLEQLDALQSGSLDLTFAGPAQLATRLEKFNILDSAYLFESSDELLEVGNGDIGAELADELLAASGLRVLSTGYYGTRHVTANFPVRKPADLDGAKMRVIDSPLWIDNGVALGANPTPVAFAELYMALQQGVVDSQENPLPTIAAQKFDEVQSHISLTAHNIGAELIVASDSVWADLSTEQQTALQDAAIAGADAATVCVLAEEDELLAQWSAPDSAIEIVSDVDIAAFEERAAEVLLPKYGAVWGDLYDRIKSATN